ncbi:uncharacterized protein TNCV_4374261 [Trichonephila clavipes]|uniref:Uncharacterized protein n=1 Tax=Trichonephila clavipes TaxID=2585209 RepID=A0A8X6UQ26_TRICX|nr:uncharacterized protein TNCV_4374261 [Trichonephila clavipes]
MKTEYYVTFHGSVFKAFDSDQSVRRGLSSEYLTLLVLLHSGISDNDSSDEDICVDDVNLQVALSSESNDSDAMGSLLLTNEDVHMEMGICKEVAILNQIFLLAAVTKHTMLMRTNDSKRGSNASSVSSSSLLNTVGSGSDNQLVRRPSGKGSRLVRRSSSKSKRDKENGAGASCVSTSGLAASSKNKRDSGVSKVVSLGSSVSTEPLPVSGSSPARTKMLNRLSNPVGITEKDCTELDVQSFHVTLTYKPRI